MADGSQVVAVGEVAEGEADLAPTSPRRATVAFWLGVASLVAWLVPTLGLPVAAVGLALAVRGRRAGAQRAGVAVVLCAVGAALSLAMWVGSAVLIGKFTR